MAVDFTMRSLFSSRSAIIDDACLILLERAGSRDRVRRIQFDRVQSLIVWRSIPWFNVIFTAIPFFVGTILMLVDEAVARSIGLVICLTMALIELWWFYCKKTMLVFVVDGAPTKLSFVNRPAKRDRIVQRIRTNIAQTQARLALVNEKLGLTAAPAAVPDNTSFEPTADQAAAEQSTTDQSVGGAATTEGDNPAPPTV